MWDRQRQLWAVVLVGNVLMNTVIATPIYVPQFIPGSTGRNIRNLPCVSRRTGETGVCMFAFTCAKANGTHLGTCIDRFYFGSCCKIDDEPDIFPQDNSIDDGSPSRPFVTTVGPIESNDIPEYFSRPKPIPEKKPSGTLPAEATTSSYAVQTTSAPTTIARETTKPTTKRPTLSTTVETTTQPVRLSTFQTVQNSTVQDSTTETVGTGSQKTPVTIETTSKPASAQTPSITRRPTTPETVTKSPSTILQTTGKPVTKKPIHSSSSHKPTASHRPVHTTVHKPETTTAKPLQMTTTTTTTTTTEKTTESTTLKTVPTTTTERIVPATRFPPRNATTIKPSTQSSTRRPISSTRKPTVATSTKKPTITTRKPSTPVKRPTTKPTSSSFATTVPVTTLRPSTTVKDQPTIATTGSTVSSTKPTSTFSTSTRPTTATTKPVHKHKPTTIRTTTSRPHTTGASRPSTLTTKPTTHLTRPKPTKIVTTTTKSVTKQEPTTTTEKTVPLSTIETTTVPVTKVRPTVEIATSTKVSSRPATRPITTTQPTLASSTVTQTSSTVTSETTTSATNKVPVQGVSQTTEEATQTTSMPGLVTWSSSSDDTTTRTPEISSTASTQMGATDSEWTPITTPDGWIMIQSPTTKKPESLEDTTIKSTLESTLQPTTSGKNHSDTTTEFVMKRPTTLTTLSTIASVTIDTELPVPMEILNMSDYKQVCGKKLFPESRIVGGSPSSFAKWPWQISLRQWRTSTYLHKCGAALLNENWAITAAHCVENVPPSDLLLRIGEHDLANEDEPYGYQERRVQIVASHPHFDPRTFEYDLALLRFYEPLLPFQPNILPICLPDDEETYVGRTAYVTGWGRLYDEGPLPSILQEVAVPVLNNSLCEEMYKNAGYIEHIPHIFICAGWRNGGFDSCEGDSGGPMVIQRARDKRWILAGVISWGIGCAVPNQPGVYTRISEFREWINQILKF
ncbi:serine protease notopleural [Halictus rubicundus]|uniref:serine protease notopleural n=1 Tax=Halictus rubicundus TaxID=77578 RepID=UPI004036889A